MSAAGFVRNIIDVNIHPRYKHPEANFDVGIAVTGK